MGDREYVFTQLARAINRFSEHKLNKVELYNECVGLIEMVDETEKTERLRTKKFWDEYKEILCKENVCKENVCKENVPYSNWEEGLNMVKK